MITNMAVLYIFELLANLICVHYIVVGTTDIFYGRFEVCTKLDVAIMFFVIWGTKIYN